MYTNVNLAAPVGVLTFLGTAFLLGVIALIVIDDQGRRYFPAEDAQRALEQSAEAGTAITAPLRPGESYTTTVVFDLPWDIKNPMLLINESDWVTHFIIGHENSPLHKKTRFQL